MRRRGVAPGIVNKFFLHAIIVESDLGARDRFKVAATAVSEFDKIMHAKSFHECLTVHGDDEKAYWDVVFVTNRLGKDNALKFVGEARTLRSFHDSAFILCVKPADLEDASIASSIAKGIDGILCEPFSVEGLRDCTKVAVNVKMNNGKHRVKIALGVIVPLVMKAIATKSVQIADAAMVRDVEVSDPAVRAELKNIQETCRAIKDVADYSQRPYEAIIADIFADFEKGVKERQGYYEGASKRLKMKFEAEMRLVQRLKADLLSFDSGKSPQKD